MERTRRGYPTQEYVGLLPSLLLLIGNGILAYVSRTNASDAAQKKNSAVENPQNVSTYDLETRRRPESKTTNFSSSGRVFKNYINGNFQFMAHTEGERYSDVCI